MNIKSKINLDTLKRFLHRLRFLADAPLIIGIFLIFCAGLGVVYLQQQWEQDDLNSKIAITSDALHNSPQNITALEEERDQKTSAMEELIDSFSNELVDIEIIAAVLHIADTHNVAITTVMPSSVSERAVGNNTYLALPLSVTAAGNLTDLLGFIESLESQAEDLKTLVFESAVINSHDDEASASLSFCFYAHPSTEELL